MRLKGRKKGIFEGAQWGEFFLLALPLSIHLLKFCACSKHLIYRERIASSGIQKQKFEKKQLSQNCYYYIITGPLKLGHMLKITRTQNHILAKPVAYFNWVNMVENDGRIDVV